jgi:hypothetical protein
MYTDFRPPIPKSVQSYVTSAKSNSQAIFLFFLRLKGGD